MLLYDTWFLSDVLAQSTWEILQMCETACFRYLGISISWHHYVACLLSQCVGSNGYKSYKKGLSLWPQRPLSSDPLNSFHPNFLFVLIHPIEGNKATTTELVSHTTHVFCCCLIEIKMKKAGSPLCRRFEPALNFCITFLYTSSSLHKISP